MSKLFYKSYKNDDFFISNNKEDKESKDNVIVLIPIPMSNQKIENDNEFVILNNFSPLKQGQVRTAISYKNEVSNKLPIILVEKMKTQKFLDSDAKTKEEHEINISSDTINNHNSAIFAEEMSVIYQKNVSNLDDKYTYIIGELNRMPEITFNVFNLSQYSEGNELLVVMYHIMHLYNFSKSLQINKKHYKNYYYNVNKKYRKNPYHNSIHGCDVTQTLYFLIKTCNIDAICNLNDLEVFSCFFASAIHDLDHPGNNNNYEIAVGSTLAISYNDKAVLENYHLCKAFSLIGKENCDVYENFSRSNYNISRAIIINMVLSTDMANHFLDINLTKARIKAEDFNPAGTDKQLMLNQLTHASDISIPVKPQDIYKEWVNRVFVEFFYQGDKERDRGLKISYQCDRHTVNVVDAQIGFIDGIVFPLYDILSSAFPNMKMINNLINNKEEFKKIKERGEKITIAA